MTTFEKFEQAKVDELKTRAELTHLDERPSHQPATATGLPALALPGTGLDSETP
jgi:hypothetical protein